MTFDPTISLGSLITLVGVFTVALGFVYGIGSDVKLVKQQLRQLEKLCDELRTELQQLRAIVNRGRRTK